MLILSQDKLVYQEASVRYLKKEGRASTYIKQIVRTGPASLWVTPSQSDTP